MFSQSSTKDKLVELWETTEFNSRYLAYKFGLTEKSVRSMVRGIKGPKKQQTALSGYHRALGMKLIDRRLTLRLGKKEFAKMCGMSHFRLRDLEKGYDDITISELIFAGLLNEATLLDATLLENE